MDADRFGWTDTYRPLIKSSPETHHIQDPHKTSEKDQIISGKVSKITQNQLSTQNSSTKLTKDIKSPNQIVDSNKTLVSIIQWGVADGVLKGGTGFVKGILQEMLRSSRSLASLNLMTESVKGGISVLDTGIGIIGIIYQCKILKAASDAVKELEKDPSLNEIQKERLAHIKAQIKFEKSLIPANVVEQFFRTVRNSFSIVAIGISASAHPLTAAISEFGGAFAWGLNTFIYGVWFHQAQQQLKIHSDWSKEFKTSESEQELSSTEILRKEMITFKNEKLREFLRSFFSLQKPSFEEFKQRLEKKMEITFSEDHVKAVYDTMKPVEGFKRIEVDKEALLTLHQDIKQWINQKKDPVLLATESKELINAPMIKKFLKNRAERKNKQLASLETKVKTDKMTLDSLQKKIVKFKSREMESLLFKKDIVLYSVENFRKILNEEMQKGGKTFTIDPNHHLQDLFETYQSFVGLSPTIENEASLQKIKVSLSSKIQDCVKQSIKLSKVGNELSTQSKSLLSDFTENQASIDNKIKDSLTPLIKTKHKIEKGFLRLNRTLKGIRLTAGTIISAIAVTLTIIGLVATPIGAAALIMTILTVASLSVTVGLLSASFYYAYKHKTHLTSVTYRQIFQSIGRVFVTASHEKTDRSISAIAHQSFAGLASSESAQFFGMEIPEEDYSVNKDLSSSLKSPEISNETTHQKVEEKTEEDLHAEEELLEAGWIDFAEKVKKEVAGLDFDPFETLDLMNEALNSCDLDLLSDETKHLLHAQLGIKIEALQEEVSKDPNAVKRLIRNFFSLNDVNYMKFIGQQAVLHGKMGSVL